MKTAGPIDAPVDNTPAIVHVIDDHDAGVEVSGSNTIRVDENVQNERGAEWDDYHLLRQGNGDTSLTYRFENLDNGTYEVFVSYVHYADRATNVPYEVLDGETSLGTVRINQKELADDGTLNLKGHDVPFESLGEFEIENGELTVRVSNDTNGWAGTNTIAVKKIADATPVVEPLSANAIAALSASPEVAALGDLDAVINDIASALVAEEATPETTAEWIAHLESLETQLQTAIAAGSDGLGDHLTAIQASRAQLEKAEIGAPRVEVTVEGDTQHITYWNPLDQSVFKIYWHGGEETITVSHPGGANGDTFSYDFGPRWNGRNYSTHINMHRDEAETNGRIGSIPGYVQSPGDMRASVEDIGIFWVPIDAPDAELLEQQSSAAQSALRGVAADAVAMEATEVATEPVIHEMWTRGDTMHIRYSNPGTATMFAFNVSEGTVHTETIEHTDGLQQGYITFSFADYMANNETARLDAMMYDVDAEGAATPVGIVTGQCIEGGISAQIESADFLESGMTVLGVRGPNILVAAKTPFENNVLEIEGGGAVSVNRFTANGVNDLQTRIVTFNTANPSGRYKLSLTDADTGRQAAGAMFIWDLGAGTLTEETEGMVLDDEMIDAFRADINAANHQLLMQSMVDDIGLNIAVIRDRQGDDMFRESKFFINDSDDIMYIENSRVAGMPDAGGIFRQLLGSYKDIVGTLLQSAAGIAVAGWSGDSQQEAEEAYQRGYDTLSGDRHIAELAIDFGVRLPSAAEIREEGLRLAIAQVDRFYGNQEAQETEYAQASSAADQKIGGPKEISQAALEHNGAIVAAAHGTSSSVYQSFVASWGDPSTGVVVARTDEVEEETLVGSDSSVEFGAPILVSAGIWDAERFGKLMKELDPNGDWTPPENLPDCPCHLEEMQRLIENDPESFVADNPIALFIWHFGAKYGFRSAPVDGSSQQCTYDGDGNLITSGWAAGSVDSVSPVDIETFIQHIRDDVIPRIFVPGDGYFDLRESNQGVDCTSHSSN